MNELTKSKDTLPKPLALPDSINYGETYLTVSPTASDDDLHKACKTLRRAACAMSWWIGDFLLAVKRRKTVFNLKGSEAAEEMATSFGVEYRTAADATWLCENVEHSLRIQCSTFTHHLESLKECRDKDIALKWVKRAAEENLSVSNMRQLIRASRITPGINQSSAMQLDLKPLNDTMRLTKQVKAKDIPAEDRKKILNQFAPIFAWMDELRAITPLKESF